ncbi:MAG TPA: di-trans,poly-cis-decaprenylcistransferase [Bryobacteraceae bacterium]|nr:di-trans,poly-cis-decaprenylcistransferase [Bryobacteraceae bacterium]
MKKPNSLHVAIIMDGNGRWASARSLPRIAGHHEGAGAVRRTIEAAPKLGVTDLTLYAFSSDNWRRPSEEVGGLMHLLASYLENETDRCVESGVRLSFIGRRDRLPAGLPALLEGAETLTRTGQRLHVRIALDYSSRDALLQAAKECARNHSWTREALSEALPAPDVDLLIRTSGEQRLSDFLLWECAYAEFVFLNCLWPEFDEGHFRSALQAFDSRQRRFGAVPAA